MTLQAAILSGKPFKIFGIRDYLYVDTDSELKLDYLYWLTDKGKCGIIPVNALLSDKWELIVVPDNLLKFPIKPIPANRPPEGA